MIREPTTEPVATHAEALQLLSHQARSGSVVAAVALERALRNVEPVDEVGEAIDKILAEKRASRG